MTDQVTDTAAPEDGQAAPETGAVTSWTDGLPDDARGYVENKGWKGPQDLLSSYQNLEKLRGVPENKLLRMPDDPAAKGAMDPIYKVLGRPETPDLYTNALGDGFDAETFKAAAAKAHELGISDKAFAGMQEVMAEQAAAVSTRQEESAAAAFDQWKASNPDGYNNAARVMGELGMVEDQIAAMLAGDKTAIYDFAAKVGARTAEKPIVHGGDKADGFTHTPASARAKVAELMADEAFMKQYLHDSPAIRQPAIERVMKLQEAASKGN